MKRVITFLLFICIIFGMLGMPALAVNDEDLTGTTNSTEIDEILDSDGDGIPDYMEIYFGTNEHLSDSDSDGVPDYIELYITWTDPLIPNGHIDTDGDGLTNAVECSFGTNADDKDTDNDRITDYDEIFLYQTDPLTKDGDDLNADEQDAPTGRSLYMIGSGIIDPDIHEYEGGGYTEPVYEGVMCTIQGDTVYMSSISYKLNFSWFGHSNATYNQDLAVVSSIAASLSYYGNYITIGGDELVTTGENAIEEWMEYHGMTDYWKYNLNEYDYGDCHMSEMHIARRQSTINGETKNVIAVFIRGTDGTLNEWQSNFEIGSTDESPKHSEWMDTTNHKGFDITANRLKEKLQEYVNTYCADGVNTFWITGHSRGGALANVLAPKLIADGNKVFCYTFASPNTTTNANARSSSYNCIFNIINRDDLVCQLPLTDWEFERYGIDKDAISIEESYADLWDDIVYDTTYTSSITGLTTVLAQLREVSSGRNGCYAYRIDGTGYHSITRITADLRNQHLSNQLSFYSSNLYGLYMCEYIDDSAAYTVRIHQQPAFLMQLLAAKMSGDLSPSDYLIINVAPYLEDAKASLSVYAGIGNDYTAHPHFPESYYLLATVIT